MLLRLIADWPRFLLGALAVLVPIHLRLAPYAADDAFIHFRVAEHFAGFGFPYFNLGEPIMGSTSTVWTLLLAGFSVVGLPLVPAVAIFNATVTALAAMVFADLAGRLAGHRGAALDVAVAVLTVAILLISSVGLMETPLAMLLIGCGLLYYLDGKPASFVVLSVAAFVRPEAVCVLAAVWGHALLRREIALRSMAVATGSVVVPMVAYGLWYFGTVVPHAVAAKDVVYSITYEAYFLEALERFYGAYLFYGWHETSKTWAFASTSLFVGALGYAWLRAPGDRSEDPRWPRAELYFLLLAPGLAIFAAYTWKKVLLFDWYVPLYTFPILYTALVTVAARRSRTLVLAFALLVAPPAFHFGRDVVATASDISQFSRFSWGARVRKYLEVGATLSARYPGSALMGAEIGALGYAFPGKVYDAVGLVSPEALAHHPLRVPDERSYGGLGAIPPSYVDAVRPEIVVSLDSFAEALLGTFPRDDYVLFREPIFVADDLERVEEATLWGSRYLNILVRSDVYFGMRSTTDPKNQILKTTAPAG